MAFSLHVSYESGGKRCGSKKRPDICHGEINLKNVDVRSIVDLYARICCLSAMKYLLTVIFAEAALAGAEVSIQAFPGTASLTAVDHLSSKEVISVQEGEPGTLAVTASFYLKENCDDGFIGFDEKSFDVSNLKQALLDVGYERCRSPQGGYNFPDYKFLGSKLVETNDKKKQQLKCAFSLADSDDQKEDDVEEEEEEEEEAKKTEKGEEREIFLYRTGYKLGMNANIKRFGSHFNARIRLDKISSRKQKLECYALLKEFIAIQNRLNQLHFGNDLDKYLILPGAQAVQETNGDGLGVGYILLIVFGVLAIIGGGFYAYRTFSKRGNKTSKRIKRRETAEGATAAGVSTASPEYDSDRTENPQDPGAATTNAAA